MTTLEGKAHFYSEGERLLREEIARSEPPYVRKRVIGDCTLYQGDCLQVMPTLGGFDAVVTDPPYGISFSRGVGGRGFGGSKRVTSPLDGSKVIGDDKPFDPEPVLSLERDTILWGANHYASKLPDAAKWLVWDKRRGTATNDFADCELAWTNIKGPARCLPHMWNGGLRDSERGIARVHQTQKAIAVMEWCLGFLPDATHILDCYMGSGTTGVACVKLGRKFTGIELDPDYFDIACARIEEACRQPDMFIEAEKPAPAVQLDMLEADA